MKYSELIELYKKNELPEQQRRQIEYDIERQEAISEYLFEKDEAAAFELTDDADFGKAGFAEKTNKSINRKFVKAGVISAAAAVVVILFIVFALPNIVSCFYYNPAKDLMPSDSGSDFKANQISTDFYAFSELTMPGYFRDMVEVHDNGYGNYDIQIQQWFTHTGRFNNISGKLVRNKLVLYDTNILKAPPQNYFAWGNLKADTNISLRKLDSGEYSDILDFGNLFNERETSTQNLKNLLTDNKQYLGYVSLDRLMDYDDFIDFISKNDFSDVWCGVVTPRDTYFDSSESIPSISDSYLGFICRPCAGNGTVHFESDSYPNLYTDLDDYDNLEKEDFAKQHFLSMLKYLHDNKKGFSVVSQITSCTYDLDSAIAYVEENGLKIHGFTITATKDELLKINDMKEVYAIETEEMR